MRMWRSEHSQIFLERLTVPSLVGLNLAGARPPRLTAKLSKPRCPPGGALLLEPTARQLLAEPNVLKSDFDTLVGLEARAVSESETEAERLRAHARRALELARAINDPEAALRLKALAADLLERADALERKDETVSAPFREVTFCASYKCHCFGVKGSRLSWFRG